MPRFPVGPTDEQLEAVGKVVDADNQLVSNQCWTCDTVLEDLADADEWGIVEIRGFEYWECPQCSEDAAYGV